MNTTEIICGACDASMRLSESLLERIHGKTGRVTCKRCSNKVSLNAKGGELIVTAGGHALASMAEILEDGEHEAKSDPHLSEFPSDWIDERVSSVLSSLPPPLPLEARVRRSMAAQRSRAAQRSMAAQPSLDELLAEMSQAPAPFEAPPPMRAQEDSLSPHSFENEDGLVELGRDFNSSPFASERDETFRSLYPQAAHPDCPHSISVDGGQGSRALVSRAPAPPRAGTLSRAPAELPLSEQPGGAKVILSSDGQLLNQADVAVTLGRRSKEKSARWVPWSVAAVSLLALGASASGALPFSLSSAKTAEAAPRVERETSKALAPVAVSAPAALSAPAAPSSPVAVSSSAAVAPDVAAEDVGAQTTVIEPQVTAKSPEVTPAVRGAQGVTPAKASESSSSLKEPEPSTEEEEEPPAVQTPFSASAASSALRQATAAASTCRGPSDPSGVADISVTFAPSGRVTQAEVSGPPFAGTKTGGCIAQTFRRARVPAFSGDHVTVTRTVTIH